MARQSCQSRSWLNLSSLFFSLLLLASLHHPDATLTAEAAPTLAAKGLWRQERMPSSMHPWMLFSEKPFGSSLAKRGLLLGPTATTAILPSAEGIQDGEPQDTDLPGQGNIDSPTPSVDLPALVDERQSRALPLNVRTALHHCDSDKMQELGPGWNGSLASNSPDGTYPSATRSCSWSIQAMTGTSPGGGTVPYIVALTFSTPLQLVCGTDYLTIHDGPNTAAPIIAKVCGNYWLDNIPTFYSSGSSLTAVFSSQAKTPGSYGFTGVWSSVAPCSVCVSTGRGTCSSANTCDCRGRYSGVVCESETAGFKEFTPRSQHAMAYDPNKDMVYITGGTSLRNPFIWDLLTYSFESNKWNKITLNTISPDARYGHFAFMHNNDLYVYGGVSVIGGMADLWRFDGRAWTKQQPINPEKLPSGKVGPACVLVNNNNSTRLYVFGGMNSVGVTTRELNVYDLNQAMWKKSDHQNSVGLSGATAVYHQATDSIYYFGGMVNQTTRNVITYQYRIAQDLWYALAPKMDPLTATPVPVYSNGSSVDPSISLNVTADDSDDGEDTKAAQYLPPVMYDPISGVWAHAGLMGDDAVVMYGGMRPFGPGVNEREQACFIKNFAVYDLSCQRWSYYDAADLDGVVRSRVNHTMIFRPPGSAGGSKTAWTAYIFGGFDGWDHGDMLNITMNIPQALPSLTNSCRALRWCSHYDDCQNCNPNYCSYVNGLCLFDTDKDKGGAYLLGTSTDAPRTGTLQELVKQRPELKSQVLAPEECPVRNALDLGNPFSSRIEAGQEMTFKIYIDAHDLDVQFEIRTSPSSDLEFKSLNVWEGFMNMYWRADHGLTDDTWDGYAPTSSPIPDDLLAVANGTRGDAAVITPGGTRNTSELMNRWTKYAGLDASLSSSAVRSNSSYIYFPAVDPRRFSGYYVFSLTNRNPIALSFTATVTLLDHPTPEDETPSAHFNMATLGFFMLGFILAIILLIFMGRKIRQLIDDRDHAHRTAEMQLLEDEEDERQRRRNGLRGGMTMVQMDGSILVKRPMYRVVVGVQKMGYDLLGRSTGSNLRQRSVQGGHAGQEKPRSGRRSISESTVPLVSPSSGAFTRDQWRRSRVRSDFIRDIGSVSLEPETTLASKPAEETLQKTESRDLKENRSFSVSTPNLSPMESGKLTQGQRSLERAMSGKGNGRPLGRHSSQRQATKEEPRVSESPVHQPLPSLQRGWSLKSLGRSASVKRIRDQSKVGPEEREGLTDRGLLDEEDERDSRGSGCYDSEQEIVDLSVLSSHTDLLQLRNEHLQKHGQALESVEDVSRRRNPAKVQPISVEPLPFHAGLVPQTAAHLRRYQRAMARKQRAELLSQNQSDTRQSPVQSEASAGLRPASRARSARSNRAGASTSRSNRNPSTATLPHQRTVPSTKTVRATRSHGSLREIHKTASRMVSRTLGDQGHLGRSKSVAEPGSRAQDLWPGHENPVEAGIELKQLVAMRTNKEAVKDKNGEVIPDPLATLVEARSLPEALPEPFQEYVSSTKRKPIKMRGRQEYEAGPLLAVNILIVFPGDTESRKVPQQGDSFSEGEMERDSSEGDLFNTEQRLPPMAIGTMFVPDPVRWWAYKAKQQLDRRRFERDMRRLRKHKGKDR